MASRCGGRSAGAGTETLPHRMPKIPANPGWSLAWGMPWIRRVETVSPRPMENRRLANLETVHSPDLIPFPVLRRVRTQSNRRDRQLHPHMAAGQSRRQNAWGVPVAATSDQRAQDEPPSEHFEPRVPDSNEVNFAYPRLFDRLDHRSWGRVTSEPYGTLRILNSPGCWGGFRTELAVHRGRIERPERFNRARRGLADPRAVLGRRPHTVSRQIK